MASGDRLVVRDGQTSEQGNRIWSLRLLKAGSTSWGSGAINSDRGCRSAEEPASVRSFARRKGSSAVNHLPDFSYAIALLFRCHSGRPVRFALAGADEPLYERCWR